METTKKKLYRSTDKAWLGGVIAGLADYFDKDIVLFRVLTIVLFILTGFMPIVLFYVLAWVLIPAQPQVAFDYEQ